MIKIFYGNKGMGKTKMLVDTANSLVVKGTGDIVFIDDSNQLMYDLKHDIRFINVSEFPIKLNSSGLLGLLCGIVSENYDINGILIDGLTYILGQEAGLLKEFFDDLDKISKKFNIDFYISINGGLESVPEFLTEYISKL